jgi:hypothetical protein
MKRGIDADRRQGCLYQTIFNPAVCKANCVLKECKEGSQVS